MDDIGLLLVGAVSVNHLALRGRAAGFRLGNAAATPDAIGFLALATGPVLVVATALTWIVRQQLLVPAGVAELQVFVLLLAVAAATLTAGFVLEARNPGLAPVLRALLPLVAANVLMLAVLLSRLRLAPTLWPTVVGAVAVATVFAVSLVLFTAICERLEAADVPAAWRGAPITLAAAGMTALALAGIGGMVAR